MRGLPAAGILGRCTATRTFSKVIEHFGSAEVWALKVTSGWWGRKARPTCPCPTACAANYVASTNHGGGAGDIDTSPHGVGLPKTVPVWPGINFGVAMLLANLVPHAQPVCAQADERKANGDPLPSLQERYGSHDGYVAAVARAASRAMAEGFLLQADATALIEAAKASAVLVQHP